jgi:orotate phosphoribosyltransferase
METERQHQFIAFALQTGVLKFGQFKTKAGRLSPYFFNAGLFHTGASLSTLAEFYAQTLLEAERQGKVQFDMLFGPAYKGITLASATAVALARAGRDVPFAFNRKEAKDHGEGGIIVGAPLRGRVVIVDDVISAGTSVRESVEIIRAAGATPAAVLLALDRQERGGDATNIKSHSAVEEVRELYGIPVFSIANLGHVLNFLRHTSDSELVQYQQAVMAYRQQYGVEDVE